MKKTTLCLLAVACLLATACKKDKNTTTNYAEELKGTTWTGTFRDKTILRARTYTIKLNPDKTFDWKDDVNSFKGAWDVQVGSVVSFAFATGNKNAWANEVKGDKMTIKNQPQPDNFFFDDDCVKKP